MEHNRLFFCNYWITYRCNSKCVFCKIWQDPNLKEFSDVNIKDAKNNLNDLKKIGVRAVDFTGGEPLLNKDLPQILRHAKNLGFFIKLSTNGLIYPDKADEIKDIPTRIYFSLDTIDSDEYKKIRGTDGFYKVLESIEIAKKFNQESCLFYTVTDDNIHNLNKIVSFSQKNRINLYIHPCFNYFGNKELSKENIKKIKKIFWKPYVRMSLPQLDFHYNGGNDPLNPSCLVGKSTIDIGPEDSLTIPCFHRAVNRVKINGNLFSIYESSKWDELFKKAGRYDFCNHCTIDCYFGLSYRDRVFKYFFKQNLSHLKNTLEAIRK
jgi:MoaA/NifB/PqqE/SkfB family radical SAM enzyme